MRSHAEYRLRVAAGFLKEAEQNFRFQLWRSCMSNAQLAVENALYGDELHGLTPWELFGEKDAREALQVARQVVHMARQLVETFQEENDEA